MPLVIPNKLIWNHNQCVAESVTSESAQIPLEPSDDLIGTGVRSLARSNEIVAPHEPGKFNEGRRTLIRSRFGLLSCSTVPSPARAAAPTFRRAAAASAFADRPYPQVCLFWRSESAESERETQPCLDPTSAPKQHSRGVERSTPRRLAVRRCCALS